MEFNNLHVVFNGTPCSDPSDTLQYIGIVLTGVLSTLGLLCSGLLLMVTFGAGWGGDTFGAGWGGDTFTMMFIRCLCAADVLACGFYGLFKTFLSVARPPWVNCFLPESALSCARIAVGFTLVMWLLDLYYYAADPVGYKGRLERKVAAYVLVFLWNCAVIIGFLPQMIWQNGRHGSEYFHFHDGIYVVLRSSVILLCLLVSAVFYWKIAKVIRAAPMSRHGNDKPSTSVTEVTVTFHGSKSPGDIAILVRPCLPVTIITCLLELPLCLFEIILCQYGPGFNTPNANILLFYLHLLVFVRSLICCVVIVLYVPELRLLLGKYFAVCSLDALKPCCRLCENSATFDLPVSAELSPDGQSHMEVYKIEMGTMTSMDTLSSVVDASGYSCSQSDSHNHLSPSTPNIQLSSVQGSAIQGSIIQGSSTTGPYIQTSTIQGPSIQESSFQSSSIQGPSIPQPSIPTPLIQRDSIQGPNNQRPNTQGPNTQGPNIQGPNIQGPNTQGPNIQVASMPEPPVQEATTSNLKLPVNTLRILVPNTHLPVTCSSDLDKPLLVQKGQSWNLPVCEQGNNMVTRPQHIAWTSCLPLLPGAHHDYGCPLYLYKASNRLYI